MPELEELMWKIRGEGDSLGAKVTVIARGVPPGWGEPVFDRLDADLAHAMMGINAVKAVEIGAGVGVGRAAWQRASRRTHAHGFPEQQRRRHSRRHFLGPGHRRARRRSSPPRASRCRARPSTSPAIPVEVVTTGRHDPCVGLRATPICEAMLAIVLMDHYLRHRGQNADVRSCHAGDHRQR